jgi:hypothetical protein
MREGAKDKMTRHVRDVDIGRAVVDIDNGIDKFPLCGGDERAEKILRLALMRHGTPV